MSDLTNSSGMYQTSDLGKKDAIVQNLSAINQTLTKSTPKTGAFQMSATASKVVNGVNINAGSVVVLSELNAAAATLQGSTKRLYAVSNTNFFTVYTASGASAAGTELLSYVVF